MLSPLKNYPCHGLAGSRQRKTLEATQRPTSNHTQVVDKSAWRGKVPKLCFTSSSLKQFCSLSLKSTRPLCYLIREGLKMTGRILQLSGLAFSSSSRAAYVSTNPSDGSEEGGSGSLSGPCPHWEDRWIIWRWIACSHIASLDSTPRSDVSSVSLP